ncbi:MAG TPA: hypothetical protein VHL09_17110, partial [Dehalococcoidia bacterium]|nr:hypothetical protein [Dehalococcoidia bacterium]
MRARPPVAPFPGLPGRGPTPPRQIEPAGPDRLARLSGELDWAFVLIDHFPLQVAIALGEIAPDGGSRESPDLIVLGGYPHERQRSERSERVVDCSPAAAARGIRPG